MFGMKKEREREIEQKLTEAEELRKKHISFKEAVSQAKERSGYELSKMEEAMGKTDGELGKALECLKNSTKLEEDVKELAKRAGKGQREESKRLEAVLSAVKGLKEQGKRQQEISGGMQKMHRRAEDKQADIKKLFEQEKLQNEQLLQTAAQMKDAAKGMSVLALNAGIEAGRMGEPGREFLHAAEEVRKLSEEFSGLSERLKMAIAESQKLQSTAVGAVEQYISYFVNEKEAAGQILSMGRSQEEVCTKLLKEEPAGHKDQEGAIDKIKELAGQSQELQNGAAARLEESGGSIQRQKEAKEELGRLLAQIKE